MLDRIKSETQHLNTNDNIVFTLSMIWKFDLKALRREVEYNLFVSLTIFDIMTTL